ncbi:unnamed protein product [Paramecium primaurelia]|uniref:Uncharacterized protein n=2 Tax=Paramecium TaxID=5884 RepID=A0A8S1XGF3_9CILI|nr:unnamed protein product [Paramecium primaurelia]CAD8199991.1 unnamed protein product [Paramecium pentaurelia]
MITLSQWKAKNFLASTSSRYYKIPDVPELKPKKQQIRNVKYKFELDDDVGHKILQQVLPRNPLLPMRRQHQPNPSQLSVIQPNQSLQQINSSIEESNIGSKTNRFNKPSLKRNSSQPLLDETKQLSFLKNNSSSKDIKISERKKSKIYFGSTVQASQTQTKFEIDFDFKIRDSSVKRRLSQKQFNLYKNRKIAVSSIANQYKHQKEEEIEARRKQVKEQIEQL